MIILMNLIAYLKICTCSLFLGDCIPNKAHSFPLPATVRKTSPLISAYLDFAVTNMRALGILT